MKVRVTAMRRSGRRFRDRDQESVLGELRLHSIMRESEAYRVAELVNVDVRGSRSDNALPPLYEPELVAIGHGSLLLRGFESAHGTGYVQEWHCVIEG